jgi:hypothetical protein
MLNLSIAMMKFLSLIPLIFILQTGNISITSPLSGDTLRGQVQIVGNMDIPGFSSAELAFSYASNPADSWFTIQTFPQLVANSTLTTWDTTSLTDGDYLLHLRVYLLDGSSLDAVVSDLKIRNDLIPATDTPVVDFSAPILPGSPPVATAIPPTAAIVYPSSTPLPANPASVTNSSIYVNFTRGGLVVLVLFFLLGIFLRFRGRS